MGHVASVARRTGQRGGAAVTAAAISNEKNQKGSELLASAPQSCCRCPRLHHPPVLSSCKQLLYRRGPGKMSRD